MPEFFTVFSSSRQFLLDLGKNDIKTAPEIAELSGDFVSAGVVLGEDVG